MPGNLAHLESLALISEELTDDAELADFLAATQATRSLGLFIKRLRIYRPIQTPYIDLDSRQIVDSKLLYRFTGSIYRNPADPRHGHISLAGEQRLYDGSEVLTYGALLPTHFNFTHDASRPSQAILRQPFDGDIRQLAYNDAAAPEYDEHDPQAVVGVIKHAATDMMGLLGLKPGQVEYAPSPESLEPGYDLYRPDYYLDDPDEFLKKQW